MNETDKYTAFLKITNGRKYIQKDEYCINLALDWLYQHGFITIEERYKQESERLIGAEFDPCYDTVCLRFDDSIHIKVNLDHRLDEVVQALVVCVDTAYIYDKDGNNIGEEII